MKYLIYLVLIGAVIGVTSGLFNSWGLSLVVPDLILLLVIALSVIFETLDYLFVAVVGGFWLDIVYSLPIGSFTIPLVLCGAASSFFLKRWLFTEIRWYHFMLAILAATVFLKVWIWGYANVIFLTHWFNYGISWKQMLRRLPLNILSNLIVAYPLYTIVEMFARSQLRWQKNRLRL